MLEDDFASLAGGFAREPGTGFAPRAVCTEGEPPVGWA